MGAAGFCEVFLVQSQPGFQTEPGAFYIHNSRAPEYLNYIIPLSTTKGQWPLLLTFCQCIGSSDGTEAHESVREQHPSHSLQCTIS